MITGIRVLNAQNTDPDRSSFDLKKTVLTPILSLVNYLLTP